MSRVTELRVNGTTHRIDVDADHSLLGVLRDVLDLTGTKYGCGESRCGACTVLVDGQPRRSCVTPVSAAASHEVTTIEGLERDGNLHPVQQAFLDAGAFQCGYCTSGMIVSGAALLSRNAQPSDSEIATFLEGNICRCGTYPRILSAMRRAVELSKEARP